MSQMIDFTLPSCQPGRTLHAFRCVPEGEVRAVLQLSHGMVEFIDRYKPLAENLAARGILVTGNDHLGHGGSIRTKEDYGYFGEPDGNRAVLEDLHAVTTLTKQLYPGVPYFLLGHSMGSFLTRTYLIRYPGTVKGAILMGTGQNPDAMLVGGKALASVLARKVGRENASDVVEKLAFGAYNKAFAPNRTGYDWLSVSEENVDAYIADPLCGGMASTGLFLELLDGMAFIKKPANLRHMNMANTFENCSFSR